MAEICCVKESNKSVSCEPKSRVARRKRMEIRRFKFISGVGVTPDNGKRQKVKVFPTATSPDEEFGVDDGAAAQQSESGGSEITEKSSVSPISKSSVEGSCPSSCVTSQGSSVTVITEGDRCPKYGVTSVCGRRRDMEDAVAIHLAFSQRESEDLSSLHFFGVYDGHGCSHVAKSCRDRLHQVVKEELENNREDQSAEWTDAMKRSFSRMDKEVMARDDAAVLSGNCRCEHQMPQSDAVGSTAVVAIVSPDKIIVANCGDSRAVLCRGGKAFPLSIDHKPDRPDELHRIQAAGGRVIYWDGPRVLGVLAMSRAIGDNYLKPFVSSEPEVTITDRTDLDECLILASDGLWDVVSNDTACGIARMCLRGRGPSLPASSSPNSIESDVSSAVRDGSDEACSDAAMLLTKLAMARNSADNVSVIVVDLRRDT
ncbi:hypothetical protein Sjap_013493 [Stephania japonica]|uniref:protein-serine/threonine phosphatase n=1 Tax=Stephania japonica TaxID=461633 RepID=A0AAP0IY01_9MAGN